MKNRSEITVVQKGLLIQRDFKTQKDRALWKKIRQLECKQSSVDSQESSRILKAEQACELVLNKNCDQDGRWGLESDPGWHGEARSSPSSASLDSASEIPKAPAASEENFHQAGEGKIQSNKPQTYPMAQNHQKEHCVPL